MDRLQVKVREKPVINLSELIKKNLERHKSINSAMPHSKIMEKAKTINQEY